jgi:hypothetical protein
MPIFAFGFLIGCLLLASPASMVIAVADVAQVVAPDASPPQPIPVEEEDFLSTLD